MAMTGMDIDQVRALATQMSHAAEQVRTLQTQLTNALHNTTWVGADKTRFEGDWNSNYARSLQTVSTALDQAAKLANSNAQEQQSASA